MVDQRTQMWNKYVYMKNLLCIIFACLLFVFAALVPLVTFAAAGNVVINEIGWMGTVAGASDEWIELYNNTQSVIDLSGWTLLLFKPATTTPSKIIALSDSIPAGGYYLIERTNDTTVSDVPADLVSSFGSLVDSGMILHLLQNEVLMDRTPDLCDNKWCAGSNNPKMSMERVRPDADGAIAANWATNNGIKINGRDALNNTINGTPKQENGAYNNPPSVSPPDLLSPPPSPSSPSHPIYPALNVDAGPDKTVLVGSSVSFSGLALGANDAPLFDARFLWNFGDGALKEGRTLEYVYYFPGIYTAALTVSSGQYSGFDTAGITAIAPALIIKNTQTGENGFISIANGADKALDLGGMIIRDSAGAYFSIPKNTFVLAGGEVTFPNRVSGVLKSGGSVALYDAVGRDVRVTQLATNNSQPVTLPPVVLEPTRAVIGVPPPAGGETSPVGEKSLVVPNIVQAAENADDVKSEMAADAASQSLGFGVSKTSFFFGASVLVGVLSAVGFFLFKNLF